MLVPWSENSALKKLSFLDRQHFLQNPSMLKDDLKSIVLCEKSCPPSITRVTYGQHVLVDSTAVHKTWCLQQWAVFVQITSILAIKKLDAESARGGLGDVIPLQTSWTVSNCSTHGSLVVKDAVDFCSSELFWQLDSIFKTFPPSV